MTRVLFALGVLLFLPLVARAACGTVNGVVVCTDNPNCGFVNGIQTCTVPTSCGVVDTSSGGGVYTCLSGATNGAIATSMQSGGSSGGSSGGGGGSYQTDKPVLDAASYIASWLNGSGDTGSTGWFKSAIVWAAQKCIILWIEFKIDMLKFGWAIFKGIYQSLNVSSAIQDAINSLDSQLANVLMYCKVPEAINLILAAFASSFIFRFIPGL